MKAFRFKALEDTGRVSRGVIELPFEETAPAIRYLERQGCIVLSMKPVSQASAWYMRVSRSLASVKRKELAEVCNNLSLLLGAGVPVLTAINDVLEDLRNPFLAQTLKFIATDIENGQTFSSAIRRHPKVFSNLIQQMCQIGEETGRLDEMLKKSADHLRHVDEIVGATKRALLYPAILSVVVVAAAAFWFMVVVPQLVGLFQDMNVKLPFITRLLIIISDLFQRYFFIVVLSIAGGFFTISGISKRSRRVRKAVDWIKLRTPVVSTIIETSLVARVSEYIGILLSAGIGVMRALEIVRDSVGNVIYEERVERVGDGIRSGQTLSASLRQYNAMHPFAVRMIAVGEQTGRIDEQTEYVASVYREKLAGLVEVLGKSLEPVMLVFLGGIFALVIGGLLYPIYDLISNISGM